MEVIFQTFKKSFLKSFFKNGTFSMEFSAGEGFVEDSHTKQYVLGVVSN